MTETKPDGGDRGRSLEAARRRLDEIRATLAEYGQMPATDLERIRHRLVELERAEGDLAREIERLEGAGAAAGPPIEG